MIKQGKHSETCRSRIVECMKGASEGREKLEKEKEKQNQIIARAIEAEEDEQRDAKRMKSAGVVEEETTRPQENMDMSGGAESSGDGGVATTQGEKRDREEGEEERPGRRARIEPDQKMEEEGVTTPIDTDIVMSIRAAWEKIDVAEVYSPPRVTEETKRWGMQ